MEGNCHGYKSEEHASRRSHKHCSSSEPSYDNGGDECVKKPPTSVGNVDACLSEIRCVAHHFEEKILIAE